VDLCVRAARAGWAIVCNGAAPAVHHQSQTITGPGWSYYRTRNRVWFARLHYGWPCALLNWLWEAGRLPRIAAGDLVKRRSSTALVLGVRGLRDAWLSKPSREQGPLPSEPRGLSLNTSRESGVSANDTHEYLAKP
jgi:GT2 family glycosyltransferase